MDMNLVRRMAAKATQQCKDDIKQIEEGLSPCFKTNPGRKLNKERCRELRELLDQLEEEEKVALRGQDV